MLIATAMALGAAARADHEPADLEQLNKLSLKELIQVEVDAAGLVPTTAERSPASVTVIGRDQLRAMGARTIYDALRTVPGLGVTVNNFGKAVVAVRGVRTNISEKVLFLVNGRTLNNPNSGSALFDDLANWPVRNVERLEIIRGPGSALFGANAFLGTVNIVTRERTEASRVGLYVSHEFEDEGSIGQRYNLQAGHSFASGVSLDGNLSVIDIPGPELIVAPDVFGRSGAAEASHEQVDFYGRLGYRNYTLTGRYSEQSLGGFYGPAGVVGNGTDQDTRHAFIEGRAEFDISHHLSWSVTAFADTMELDSTFVMFPAGSIPPASFFAGFNANGLIEKPDLSTFSSGGVVQFTYTGWHGHALAFGFSGEFQSLHDLRREANGIGLMPLPAIQDITSILPFQEPTERHVIAGFVEDRWDIRDNLQLTAGIRVDDYSDFGSTVNPRVGMTWNVVPGATIKALYGTAFRAPDFVSLGALNNVASIGNPDLEEETIDSWEIGLHLEPVAWASASLTYFNNSLDDLIGITPGTPQFRNVQSADSEGIELQAQAELWGRGQLRLNYTYSDVDVDVFETFVEPEHRGYVGLDLALPYDANLHLDLHLQSETPREPADARSALPGYAYVNTTLTAPLPVAGAELQLSVYNLLDKDYRYPSQTLVGIPGDLPAPGRSFLLGLELEWP